MIDGFRLDLITTTGFKLGVNYGWNKVRFPAPVPAGSRVRAKAEVVSVDEIGGGWWQVVTRFTLEVEGSEKPAAWPTASAARSRLRHLEFRGPLHEGTPLGVRGRAPGVVAARLEALPYRYALCDRRCRRHSPAPTAASAAAPVAVASTAPRSTGVPPASA